MQIDKRNIDTIKPIEINDHILAFYAGRNWTRIRKEYNWVDDGAMKLGLVTYAIYKNNQAVIYDTFADIRQAKWVRKYLENIGIKQFTVILSHWHLDHIAGNEIYKDCNIISNSLTHQSLLDNKNEIEEGCCDGPPEIKPLILPNITFNKEINVYIDDLLLELKKINIHSEDGTIVYIPDDKILISGDILEDTVTYIDEANNLVEHVKNLQQLKQLDITAILPNHGDPDVIEGGGYDKTFIEATINYIRRMVRKAHDINFLKSSMKSYIQKELDLGWIQYYEPYEEVHNENLIKVYDYFKNRQLPTFPESENL